MESGESALMARMIDAIGCDDFVGATAHALCGFTSFEMSAVVLHRPDKSAVLFDDFDRVGCRAGLDNYVRWTHRINPMLRAPRRCGALRARDFALGGNAIDHAARNYCVASPEEELGFRTIGWPERLEEVALHFPGWGGMVEFGLYRERGRNSAPDDLVDALAGLGEPIAAAFERHRAFLARIGAERLPHPALSARENQVCALLLEGCSTAAIALRLGIACFTVKDHRKAIFRKLGVGTLAELFGRFR
jgi:DNA-binding CsgD family transcriptional regulator